MPHIPPITDAYIDEIVKAPDAYNPTLNKTQGVKLRELLKLMRDRSIENDLSGVWDNNSWRPYHSVSEVLEAISPAERFLGMTILIQENSGLKEFWFNTGLTDADLIEKVPVFSIAEYNHEKVYKKEELVWQADVLTGDRILYQSLVDGNLNGMDATAIPNLSFSPVPIAGYNGIVFPYPNYGYTYDENNELKLLFYHFVDNQYQTYPGYVFIPKVDDGRKMGIIYNSLIGGSIPPSEALLTVTIIVSDNAEENPQIIINKAVTSSYFIYYETPEGTGFKITPDPNATSQNIDIRGIEQKWKLLGQNIDTSKFLDTTQLPQVKSGNLTIKGIGQFELQTNSKNKRVLYEINPYSQRDTQNGFIEESTFQVPGVNEGKLHDYRILGYFYSEGYFDNSLEIVLTAYTGLTRKYVLFNSEGRGEGSGSGFLGEPSTWFKLVPDIDGGGYGTGDIQLEALWHYPHGWYIRAKVVLVADAENGGGDGGVSGFSMYVKTYQGTFTRTISNSNDDIVTTPLGIPNRGNDSEPTTLSFGTAKFAQSLKVYKTPTDEFDVVRLKDLNGGGNPPEVDYIQASPATPQDANINIYGNFSAGGSISGRTIQGHATNENGNVVGVEGYSLITSDDGYGGRFFAAGTGEQENRGLVVGASGGNKNIGLEIYDTPEGDNNHAIYSGSTAQSFFAGNIRANANLSVANTLDGSTIRVLRTGTEDFYNFYVDPTSQRVYLGMGTSIGPQNGPTVVIGDYDTGINWNGDGDISLTSNNNNVITVNGGSGINFKVQQEWNFGSWGNGISYLIYNNTTGDLAHVSAENMPFLSKDLANSYILGNSETPQSANINIVGDINIGSGDSITTIKKGVNNATRIETNGLEIFTNYDDRKIIAQFGESYNTFYGAVVANNLTSGAYNYFESQNSATSRGVGIGSERGLYYTKEENGSGTSLKLLANDWSQNRTIYLPDADGTVVLDDQVLHKTGNETKNGDLSIDGKINASQDVEISDSAKGLILMSPNCTRWRITVSDSGVLTTTAV